jgi:hypothetical protein
MTEPISLQEQLDEQRRRSEAKRPDEVNDALAGFRRQLADSGVGSGAPKEGEPAPRFSLPNVRGATVQLADLLGRGPVLLAFYRGVW